MKLAVYWEDLLHYHVARIEALYDQAEGRGYEVRAYTLRASSPELPIAGYHALLNDRISVVGSAPTSGVNNPETARAFRACLDSEQPDAVAIVGYENLVALAALQWCRTNRRAAILMSASQASDFYRTPHREWVKRQLAASFDAAIVGGAPQFAYLQALGFDPESIYCGYDVVDNDFYRACSDNVRADRELWQHRLGLPSHFFLAACRLIPKKNLAGLIRTYSQYVASTDRTWPLIIAGDGELRTQLESLAIQLGVGGQVVFIGYLSSEQMARTYALASVFILPSGFAEQWGLVVNEAMAAGVPVLVSKICGCVSDLVVEGVTGFTFAPSDEDRLCELMTEFTAGQHDLAQMGKNSQDHISNYSPTIFAANLLSAAETAVVRASKRGSSYSSRAFPWLVSRIVSQR